MLRKLLATSLLSLATFFISYSQVGQGALKGKVTDKVSKEPLPFVNVVLELNGTIVTGAASDFDGEFTIKPIPPGKYNVKASFTGYQPVQISGVVVNAEKITFQNITMTTTAIDIKEFEVIEYSVPLIEKDNTATGATVTREDIDKLPGRSATSVAQTVGGVYSKDNGSGDLNIRGARSDANYYFIDGIKVRGSSSLPKASIEQVSVITGGLPAQYGDVTGGVISITTRGASSEYGGSIDYSTSGYKIGDKTYGLDAFGFNLLEYSINGPLLMKKDTSGKSTKPLLGFFLSGNFSSEIDNTPSAIGVWKVKDDVLNDLIENPLRHIPGKTGADYNHEFLSMSDLEKVKTRQNAAIKGMNVSGKIDVNTGSNTNLTFGGNLDFNKEQSYERSSSVQSRYFYENSLMNSRNNPERVSKTWRAYGRFTQRFSSGDATQDEKSASIIKNAFYSVQMDYNKYKRNDWDDVHKDNFFNYGYVGKFKTYRAPYYQTPGPNNPTNYFKMQTFRDTLITFEPGTLNPEIANFTQSYYELFGWQGYDAEGKPIIDYSISDPNAGTGEGGFTFYDTTTNSLQPVLTGDLEGYFDDLIIMQTNRALLNGDQPDDVYNIWRTPAYQYNGYEVENNSQFRINATGSADIKDHAISLGFEYEQRVDRGFYIAPVGLWTLGRQNANSHITGLDFSDSTVNTTGTEYNIVSFDRLNASPGAYDASDGIEPQYFFDYNLRNKLGLDPDGTDWIDFDSYDPSTYSIDMFSADELNNYFFSRNGSGTLGDGQIAYYGYDHHGKLSKENPSFDDFFIARDEFGNFTRPIGAFRPVYVAGYIQDKFSFDDLVFNIGLRIDRYDGNQKVLKDPFCLFQTIKAGEDLTLGGKYPGLADAEIPSNVGSGYVVYVDDIANPSKIVGFRNGDKWFNSQGSELNDSKTLRGPSGIAPLLLDNKKNTSQDITSDGFVDYKPQTNFMPRIAFSFPISDEALFFAHYDRLSKRPTSGERLNPAEYYYLQTNSFLLNNPNLKPELTIDYEVGYKQKLNNSSALTLSAFYRELRDQVQVINVVDAYPRKYTTYGNIDFGTIKGLSFSYDLRKTGNLRMRASYTLQFAEGTGSNSTSGLNLARADKQNLRTISPFSYDQRHAIVTSLDYRYGVGKDYDGPVWFEKQVFANTGLNFVFNAGSGTPYNSQSNVTGEALIVGGGSSVLEGKIYGSRLPWQFRADARVDRDIELTWKIKGEGEEKTVKSSQMNIYLQILNVFNAKNIVNVYRATGNTDDDGYLSASIYQKEIQGAIDEQSFRELYNVKVNTPFNYSLPRRIRLGVVLNF